MNKHCCSRIAALEILYHESLVSMKSYQKWDAKVHSRRQSFLKIVERHKWSRSAEEVVMQDKVLDDHLYASPLASIAVWENEVSRQGRSSAEANDRWIASWIHPAYINFGDQYANNMWRRSRYASNSFRPQQSQHNGIHQNDSWNINEPNNRANKNLRFPKESDCFQWGRPEH